MSNPPTTKEGAAAFASLSTDEKRFVAIHVGQVLFKFEKNKSGSSGIVRYLRDMRRHIGAAIVLLDQADDRLAATLRLPRPSNLHLDWLRAQERSVVLALRHYSRLDRGTTAPKKTDIEILIELLATLIEEPVRKVGNKHELSDDFAEQLRRVWHVLPNRPVQMRPANAERFREMARSLAPRILSHGQVQIGLDAEEAHAAAMELFVKYLFPPSKKAVN